MVNNQLMLAEYDSELLDKRMKIRTLIMLGKIDEAINDINDINSEVLTIFIIDPGK